VLISLLAAAVNRSIIAAEQAANRTEIGKLEVATQSFLEHFKVKYLPSRIRLRETGNYGTGDQLDIDSPAFLRQMWPNLTFPVDWNGDGAVTGNPDGLGVDQGWVLEGDQCLVFFLGGIPAPTVINVQGFSANKRNPAAFAGASVIAPFYEFKPDRLVRIHGAGNRFFSYLDYHGRSDGAGNPEPAGPPYRALAYFSSHKAGNDYNTRYPGNDCALLGVLPYYQTGSAPPTYFNRNGFQIISAGSDGLFGAGGAWTPGSSTGNGADDQANFHQHKLGDQ
jgi:hypothetical protein